MLSKCLLLWLRSVPGGQSSLIPKGSAPTDIINASPCSLQSQSQLAQLVFIGQQNLLHDTY